MVTIVESNHNNNYSNIRAEPNPSPAKLDLSILSPARSSVTLKNEVSISANEKVEKVAVKTLGLGGTLLGIFKALVLFAIGCAIAFLLVNFLIHVALPAAICLGILAGIGIIFYTVGSLFEIGRLNYQPLPADYSVLPKC